MLGNEVKRRRYDHLISWAGDRQRVSVYEDSFNRSSAGRDILEELLRELVARGISFGGTAGGRPWGCRGAYGRRCQRFPRW